MVGNGIIPNGISPNGINVNGINANGLTGNGDPNVIPVSLLAGVTLDFIRALFDAEVLLDNSTMVELLPYLVRCTLDPSEQYNITINETTQIYNGSFGLAPSFPFLPLTDLQQELVSACLIAHVNHFGIHVLISARNVPYVPATLGEMSDHQVYEGAFFGNVFLRNETMYSCIGDPKQYALAHSPDRVNRVCTENSTCGMVSMGLCSEACRGLTENYGYSYCTGADGKEHVAMNVFLKSYPSAIQSIQASPATIALGAVVGVLVVALVGVAVFTYSRLH